MESRVVETAWAAASISVAALLAWIGRESARSGTAIWNTHLARVRIGADVLTHLEDLHGELFLRHVRDGHDYLDEKGDLRNKDHRFKRVNRDASRSVRWRCRRNVNCQFKCYFEILGGQLTSVDAVKGALKTAGFSSIDRDGTPEIFPNRYWFILPGYPSSTTIEGYTNNSYPPASSRRLFRI